MVKSVGVRRSAFARHFCRSELAPGGVPTMDVNDDAGCLNPRGAPAFFASRLAPTGGTAFSCGQVGQ
ncbi:hypothetical protein DOZ80_17965 [Pseudomonas fluorescens]|uniref:Uncharacterized protein n=1 Tax=Pseudomonas fluorescens TaxID=294 RepID=A0A327N0X7_PSEFL|nr:hypothetical protein DOZ80_17965 [Pseudomonas fluorescens]